jgi:pimeloyl-ACP methyl ester carboxylesterase
VDYPLTRPDVDGDNLALMGMSLGGYLGARAAAFEHRFRAAIFFDGVYDFSGSLRAALPREAIAALDAGDTVQGEEIIQKRMLKDTSLRWSMTQGVWSFGASSISDFFTKAKQLTMDDTAGRLSEQAREELVKTLADLLLEALGEEINELRGANVSKDRRRSRQPSRCSRP